MNIKIIDHYNIDQIENKMNQYKAKMLKNKPIYFNLIIIFSLLLLFPIFFNIVGILDLTCSILLFCFLGFCDIAIIINYFGIQDLIKKDYNGHQLEDLEKRLNLYPFSNLKHLVHNKLMIEKIRKTKPYSYSIEDKILTINIYESSKYGTLDTYVQLYLDFIISLKDGQESCIQIDELGKTTFYYSNNNNSHINCIA